MTDKVHYLGNLTNSAILTLEEVLEKAKAGEIDSLFLAGTLKSGDVMGCLILDDDSPLFTLLGRIEAGKHELVSKVEGLTQDIDYAEPA